MNQKYKARYEQIHQLFNQAETIALELVEEMARDVLKKRGELESFCMAMGAVNFTDKDGEDLDLEDREYFKDLDELIEMWNKAFGLTGNPMYFTADGPKVTKW